MPVSHVHMSTHAKARHIAEENVQTSFDRTKTVSEEYPHVRDILIKCRFQRCWHFLLKGLSVPAEWIWSVKHNLISACRCCSWIILTNVGSGPSSKLNDQVLIMSLLRETGTTRTLGTYLMLWKRCIWTQTVTEKKVKCKSNKLTL